MKTKLLVLTTTGLLYANGKATTTSRLLSGGGLSGGETNYTAPTHYGDTKHARAHNEELTSTTNIIHDQLMNGIRQDFDFFHKSITGGSDSEGFVREGIVFCGRTFDNNGNQRTDGNLTAIPSDFSSDTMSLAVDDGLGGTSALDIDEKALCRDNACEEGSFVSTIANRVRSIGYHITHSDICAAKATEAWNINPILTCQLNGYNGLNNSMADADFESYSYEASTGVSNNDWLQQRDHCYKKSEVNCNSDCTWNSQDFCAPSNSWIAGANLGSKTYTISRDASTEGNTLSANEVRRETAYQNPAGQSITDRVYVTGVEADLSGAVPANNCKSLRQYVAALNGLAQINSFRDLGILEGENVWNSLIEEIRKNFNSIAVILNDYYEESTKLFPLIEFEDVVSCPVGITEFEQAKDEGTESSPLCTLQAYNTNALLRKQGEQAQSIIRSKCFCRQLPGSSDALGEADEIYLEYNKTKVQTLCDANNANKAIGDEDSGYCSIGDKDEDSWKRFLKELEPVSHKIKVYSGNAADIYTNLKDTLNLVDVDGYSPTCGRLVSSKKGFATSNKGGNCLPFLKLNQVLYRLELDTSALEEPDLFMLGQVEQVASLFQPGVNVTIKDSENIGKVMKEFDGFQKTVDDAQVHEASFNVKVATGLKRAVARDNEVVWLALRDELTSMDTKRIGYSVAQDAAEHFMRITTTDHDDNAVDTDDVGGEDPNVNPTALPPPTRL